MPSTVVHTISVCATDTAHPIAVKSPLPWTELRAAFPYTASTVFASRTGPKFAPEIVTVSASIPVVLIVRSPPRDSIVGGRYDVVAVDLSDDWFPTLTDQR